MNCRFKVSLLAASLTLAAHSVFAAQATISESQIPTLTPEAQHAIASQRVANRFTRSHYKHFNLDDAFSKGIFDRYLESLDYNKNIFTQSDIDKFKPFETEIDDQLKSGDTKAAFDMFNLSMKRRYERFSYALTLLDHEIKFDADESMELDRSKSAWPKNISEVDELWRQRVKYDALNLKLTGKKWPEIKELLTKRYNNAIKRITQAHSEDAFQIYMNAFARQIDPHTSYLSPRSADEFQAEMSLSLEGIGAVLQSEDDYTIIRSLVTGGPAATSKELTEGDKIIGVGQDGKKIVDIIGMRLDDVVQLIKGPKGTKVNLQILPAGKNAKSHVVTIVRDKIRLEDRAVKSKVIEKEGKKIGVLEVPSFYVGLSKDTAKLLAKFNKDNVDGVVVDLRNNGGGALTEAIGLSGLFIKQGPVVQVRDSYDRVNVDSDTDGIENYSGPLTVLINRYSASASEIYAAAMQDYDRAIILGENSYGKGSVQQHRSLTHIYDTFDQELGYVQYTIQKFYRISGGSTQMKGVSPDIAFPSAIAAEDTGESVEDNALPWDQIPAAKYQQVESDSKHQDQIIQLAKEHVNRIANDVEFKFIDQDIKRYQLEKDDTTISLNEKHRELEADKADQEALNRINKRQKLAKKPVFKALDDVPKDYEAPDAYLDEAVSITADLSKI
ncbi:carboxy terminal-processing peptidase [Vibrio casei]|uniref:Carboxy terminal-processing peptidase n=1 Tax=Vibrio casei TaxID=673372 RepID=A0A368LN01_9VIBR|nr:carboxy terminal-processing peptidase [Vibrio casei]RCS73227.1 carboxy terminal-processing peptidase [Vibrio casei]SJN18707.1 Tail-specific protease precursor [Vibrio casei]